MGRDFIGFGLALSLLLYTGLAGESSAPARLTVALPEFRPAVDIGYAVSGNQTMYQRYVWNGERYVPADIPVAAWSDPVPRDAHRPGTSVGASIAHETLGADWI